jgi:hypothetical protein
MNGVPIFICAGCPEKVHHELDQAAINYDAIVPNYPNGLALGSGAVCMVALRGDWWPTPSTAFCCMAPF